MFFEGYMGDSPKDKKTEEAKPIQGVLETELPDTDDVETYTVQQVMDILDVSRGTIYTLANRGFIEAKEYLFHSRPRKLFTQASVDAYKQKLDSTITVTKASRTTWINCTSCFPVIKQT
jgi:transposase